MLAFTPDVEDALEWFRLTHEQQVVGMGAVIWQRTSFPRPGPLAHQDARLMQMLDVVRTVMTSIANSGRSHQSDARELAAFKRQQQRR